MGIENDHFWSKNDIYERHDYLLSEGSGDRKKVFSESLSGRVRRYYKKRSGQKTEVLSDFFLYNDGELYRRKSFNPKQKRSSHHS